MLQLAAGFYNVLHVLVPLKEPPPHQSAVSSTHRCSPSKPIAVSLPVA